MKKLLSEGTVVKAKNNSIYILTLLIVSLLSITVGCTRDNQNYYNVSANFELNYDYRADTTSCNIVVRVSDDSDIADATVRYNGLLLENDPTYDARYETPAGFTFQENEEFYLEVKISQGEDYSFHEHTLGIIPTGGPTADTLHGNEHIEIRFDSNRDGFDTKLTATFRGIDDNYISSSSVSSENSDMITFTLPVVDEASKVELTMKCVLNEGVSHEDEFIKYYKYTYTANYEYKPE
jgi:hypothetical protein